MRISKRDFNVLNGAANLLLGRGLDYETVKILYAENILLGGGVGDKRHLVKIEKRNLALFRKNADHPEIPPFYLYSFAQSRGLAEKLILHLGADYNRGRAVFDVVFRQKNPRLGAEVKNFAHQSGNAQNRQPVGFIPVRSGSASENHRHYFFQSRHVVLAPQSLKVFFLQGIREGLGDVGGPFGLAPGQDRDGFGAKPLNLPQNQILGPFSERNNQNDRRDSDDYPQNRKHGAGFVAGKPRDGGFYGVAEFHGCFLKSRLSETIFPSQSPITRRACWAV